MNFSKEFRVKPGHSIKLKHIDTSETGPFDKEKSVARIEKNNAALSSFQNLLYAENRRSLLIVLQGMDTSGKDGVIRHVMKGVNPQGCSVTSFKAPSAEELDHDFLWRIHKAVPAKGDIGIFNRSHYEDVLITRVRGLISKQEWNERYKQINHFEKTLTENGVVILKFFLHISKQAQKERLQTRLEDPAKNWKFSENDLKERKYWGDYTQAYEGMLHACSTDAAPWFIVPSDKKWFRNLVVSEVINETLATMKLKLPPPLTDVRKIKIV
jgi:PPK2 family polyphosphate:nucleotide phosphotransferase